jgi:putative Holliday junction resolvase
MTGRILAVDPGEKHLGIAISDPTGTVSRPLTILQHVSRPVDAATIVALAHENNAVMILIGQALDEENQLTPQSRRASRLAAAIQQQTTLPVVLWDESGSTNTARQIRRSMGVSRRQRSGHLDDLAAAIILQSYLDAQSAANKS